jgi:hypothetical protein
MIDVDLFQTCSYMPSRCRSPLAVRAAINFRFISDCPGNHLGTQRTPHNAAPQCSSYLSSHFDRLYPLP